jgi:hypothetical protein
MQDMETTAHYFLILRFIFFGDYLDNLHHQGRFLRGCAPFSFSSRHHQYSDWGRKPSGKAALTLMVWCCVLPPTRWPGLDVLSLALWSRFSAFGSS